MNYSNFIQSLESRRMMSAIPSQTVDTPPITEYAAISQKVRIAYIPTLEVAHLSQLNASINWGDQTLSNASFERDKNGGIDIIGTHQYTTPGVFSISTYVYGLGSIGNTATVGSTPPKLTAVHGKPLTADLAAFFDSSTADSFTAKINWGDGGPQSPGHFTDDKTRPGNQQALGTHVYIKPGIYMVHAYIYLHVKGVSTNFTPLNFATQITVT